MLYNIKKSFARHQIKQKNHTIYFEEYGNPKGISVLFLHGGPGSGCNDNQKALFDYKKFRVIFLDQRGAGKSVPKGSVKNNTTLLLINDIELVRKYLKIESWIVVGGSWGATLAVAYAEIYNTKVEAMILRSLFLGTKKEVDWAFFEAPMSFRPQLFYEINYILNQKKLVNPIYVLGPMLENKDKKIKSLAAHLWLAYESNLSTIKFNYKNLDDIKFNIGKKETKLPNTPFIEWHYIKNNFFLEQDELIKNAYKLNGIPGSIVQGRYDLLCPVINAYEIAAKWKNSNLIIVDEGAHSANSDPMRSELIKAINDLTNKLI